MCCLSLGGWMAGAQAGQLFSPPRRIQFKEGFGVVQDLQLLVEGVRRTPWRVRNSAWI